MIRAEHLRAKSHQAEVTYLADLMRVSNLAKDEHRCRRLVQDKVQQFWSEALQARQAPSRVQSTHESCALERMWRTHDELQRATNDLAARASALRSEVSNLVASKERLDLIGKLTTKQQRLRRTRLESRLSDELAELTASVGNRAVCLQKLSLPINELNEQVPLRRAHTQAPSSEIHHSPLTQRGMAMEPLPCISAVACAPAHMREIQPIVARAISISYAEDRATLSLRCNLKGSGPIGLSLVRDSGGMLAVNLDVGGAALRSCLAKERTLLLTKLNGMGIRVTSIEVGLPETINYQKGGKMKRSHGDDDEDIIA